MNYLVLAQVWETVLLFVGVALVGICTYMREWNTLCEDNRFNSKLALAGLVAGVVLWVLGLCFSLMLIYATGEVAAVGLIYRAALYCVILGFVWIAGHYLALFIVTVKP